MPLQTFVRTNVWRWAAGNWGRSLGKRVEEEVVLDLKRKRQVLWGVVIVAFLLTWLPNFGVLNSLVWVGPLPLPMAWVLFLNVILTICVILLWPLCFKPTLKKLREEPIEGEEVE